MANEFWDNFLDGILAKTKDGTLKWKRETSSTVATTAGGVPIQLSETFPTQYQLTVFNEVGVSVGEVSTTSSYVTENQKSKLAELQLWARRQADHVAETFGKLKDFLK